MMGVKRTMTAIRKLQQAIEIKEISSNFFQFIFASQDDKKKVLNVPLNWMSTEVGIRIGKIFNGVKNVVICKIVGEQGSFIKLLVALSLKEPIPRCTSVKLGDQRVLVAFRFERLVNLCYYCRRIGHLDRGCGRQYGEWLKALETYPGGRFNYASSSGEKGSHPNNHKGVQLQKEQKVTLIEEQGSDVMADSQIGGEERKLDIVAAKDYSPMADTLKVVDNLAEKSIEVEDTENFIVAKAGLQLRATQHGGTKRRSSWKRKATQEGRLVRMSELHLRDPSSLVDIKHEKAGSSSKRYRELVICSEGKTDKEEETLEKRKKITCVESEVEKASLKWPQVGLLFMWDLEIVVRKILGNEFCIQMEVKGEDLEIGGNKQHWGSSWLIVGDWNDIISNEEKRGGNMRLESSFIGFIEDMEMKEVDQKGAFFTWGNNRFNDGYVEERLDKVFISWERRKRFIFDKSWLKMEGVHEAVQEGWQVTVAGSQMYQPIHKNSEQIIKHISPMMKEMRKEGQEMDLEEGESMVARMSEFYSSLFASKGSSGGSEFLQHISPSIYENMNQELIEPVEKEEIKAVLYKMDSDKAPGEDVCLDSCVSLSQTAFVPGRNLLDNVVIAHKVFHFLHRHRSGSNVFMAVKLDMEKPYDRLHFLPYISFNLNGSNCGFVRASRGLRQVVKRSSKYLGLPLGIGASKKDAFQYVVDSVSSRIGSWKNNFLSTAGKEVLIKSVLQALPVFVMSCFLLPTNSLHWMSWDRLSTPKSEGGLGFHDLKEFNKALILKKLWRMISSPDLLVCKVLKSKYYPQSYIFDWLKSSGDSWLWKSGSSLLPALQSQMSILIRNGAFTKLSDYNWIPGLMKKKPELKLQIDGYMFWVKDLLCAGGSSWDVNLVQAQITAADADKILQIRHLNPRAEDIWKYSFVIKGKFSIKKAYADLIAQKVRSIVVAESSLMAGGNKKARNRCWDLKVMGKVKHFIWQCFSNLLLVQCNLKAMGMDIDIKFAPVQWNKIHQDKLSVKEWWWWICTMSSKDTPEDRIQLSTYILWWLWKARNIWMFEKQWMPSEWLTTQEIRVEGRGLTRSRASGLFSSLCFEFVYELYYVLSVHFQ
ncbi:RNA-directed DNA polymerase (reversetranscriptase)-related family protein [Striga asiatica]|uniref:RNA-directed DNA polymerase (Reversetranscriptase)-related family protein n=1 Tax=Striga asiatica TaxID=4170 RepID=A0A5A7Q378_STRAF|nr:RNA-directed DNA polymerase (reversetranscriptase)-related family protein [Striga asiatica]